LKFFMETIKIVYKIKTASTAEILQHLKNCSSNFSPPLDERVDVDVYSQKLHEKSITFEAWNGHLLAGLLAAYFNQNTRFVFVTNVSVLKDYMGLGIASELLRQCITDAQDKNFDEIKLEVHAENYPAIALYRKFNFINDGGGNDCSRMKMELRK
jgi:ribosomal protein S18 acetylase RimI-like enzyme